MEVQKKMNHKNEWIFILFYFPRNSIPNMGGQEPFFETEFCWGERKKANCGELGP